MSEGCGQILHSFFVIEWKRRKGTDVEKVTGYVEHIVFRNEENGYTVFHLENEDGEVTCVGNLNFITEGEMLELEGEYVNHSVYGNQLKSFGISRERTGRSGFHRTLSWIWCD